MSLGGVFYNVHYILLVDDIVEFFHILTDSSNSSCEMSVEISSYNCRFSISHFCLSANVSHILQHLCLMHTCLGLLYLLGELIIFSLCNVPLCLQKFSLLCSVLNVIIIEPSLLPFVNIFVIYLFPYFLHAISCIIVFEVSV